MKKLLLIIISLYGFNSKAQDCKFLKHCKLEYTDGNNGVIIFNDKSHFEYYGNKNTYIKSSLEWINDCEYIATMTAVTLPNFPYKPGDKMRVIFNKIENDFIYGIATIDNQKFPVKFKIIDKNFKE